MHEKNHNPPSQAPERIDSDVEWSYKNVTPEKIIKLKDVAIARVTEAANAMIEKRDLSFQGTLGTMHEINDMFGLEATKLVVLQDLHPDKEVRDAASLAYEALESFDTDFSYREDIYELIQAYAETPAAAQLEGEEARLLERTMRGYHRIGFDLDRGTRQELADIKKIMNRKVNEFEKNIRDDATSCAFTKEQLAGVPESNLEQLDRTDDGAYIVVIPSPAHSVIVTKATNRDVRKQLGIATQTRLIETNAPLIDEVTTLRQKTATLLGYESWAHFKLEERMAKTPQAVHDLYDQLVPGLTEKSRHEIAALETLLHADGYDGPLEGYDLGYYGNKQREQDYTLDQEKIAEYFPLETTLRGLFDTNGAMFGITINETDGVDTWHDDVRTYEIMDTATGKKIADLCMDLFPREGKYKHFAAMQTVAGRELPDGTYRTPMSVMMANFTEPTSTKPSLLKHSEVETLFHEFGHQLHHTLTKARFSTFAGSKTERDFVEAPSQINENWIWNEDVLRVVSSHYQTGEPLPSQTIADLQATRQHNIAIDTLTQVSFGTYDMLIHGPQEISAIDAWAKACQVRATPQIKGTFVPATINHFMSGYDAGYYGYLWARSIGDDLYGRFIQEGVLNPEVGMRWRKHVYEQGGTIDAIDIVRGFLEREPNGEAFLRNLDLAAVNSSSLDDKK